MASRCTWQSLNTSGDQERDHAEIVQARKALTDYIFGQVAAGQTDEQRLVVAGLAHLKSRERTAKASKP